jgi:hypothetical protein
MEQQTKEFRADTRQILHQNIPFDYIPDDRTFGINVLEYLARFTPREIQPVRHAGFVCFRGNIHHNCGPFFTHLFWKTNCGTTQHLFKISPLERTSR